jgi:hypothetical protein
MALRNGVRAWRMVLGKGCQSSRRQVKMMSGRGDEGGGESARGKQRRDVRQFREVEGVALVE